MSKIPLQISAIEDGLPTGTLNKRLVQKKNITRKSDLFLGNKSNSVIDLSFLFEETSTISQFEISKIKKLKLNKIIQRPQSPTFIKKRVRSGEVKKK